MGRQALVQTMQDSTDPKEDKLVSKSKTDPRQAVNAKSLVRAGKKIGSKAGTSFLSSQLRKVGGAAKVAGRSWGPALLIEELLRSKPVGTDKYGRYSDTQKGAKAIQLDSDTADYYAQYGAFPENTNFEERNPQAIFDRIKEKTKQQVMAEQLRRTPFQRARGINRQPTPEELARQSWGRKLINPQAVEGE